MKEKGKEMKEPENALIFLTLNNLTHIGGYD